MTGCTRRPSTAVSPRTARTGSTVTVPRSPTPARPATCTTPRAVSGEKVRASPASFADHFSQATMFYASLTEVERVHLVEAFTFELGKVRRT